MTISVIVIIMKTEVNKDVLNDWQRKILEETGHVFKKGKDFGEIGKNPTYSDAFSECEFCSHPIKWEYFIIDETEKVWKVGSECVGNLLALDETKKRVLKTAIARTSLIDRALRKYSDILEVIKNNGTTATYKQLIDEGKIRCEKLEDTKDEVVVVLPMNVWHTKEKYLKGFTCREHLSTLNAFNCVGCLSAEIIRKITEVGIINTFWLDKYEELTKSKLPEVKLLRKTKEWIGMNKVKLIYEVEDMPIREAFEFAEEKARE